jgi:hypothetical protein
MDAPQCVHPYVPSNCMLYWMFRYTQHSDMYAPQYVHTDVPSDYVLLNVLLSRPHDMYIPQCVSYIKKKRGSNIGILKRGKNIMKRELQISYTDITSADLCSLSISINSLKPNDF